jgi:hypothetical protein
VQTPSVSSPALWSVVHLDPYWNSQRRGVAPNPHLFTPVSPSPLL